MANPPFDSTPHGRRQEGEWLAERNIPVVQRENEPWWQRDDRAQAAADWRKRNGQ